MNASRLAALPIALLALAPAAPTAAYEVQRSQDNGVELKWSPLPMKFNIHTAAAPGLSAAATQAAFRAGYQAWVDVSCAAFTTRDGGLVNNEMGNRNDRVNTNAVPSGWPASYGGSTLGLTLTQYDPESGKIMDADTVYNPSYSWANNGNAYAIDLQAVATHEIGHQLGLDHTPIPEATMFYSTGQGNTSQRSLHSDDIAGVCHLYPSGQVAPPECTKPEDCAVPLETCDDGKCVPVGAVGYGSPCQSPDNCTSGICLESAGNTFCSQHCGGTAAACPNDDRCVPAQSPTGGVVEVCLPNSGGQAQPLGAPCQNSLQCESEICVSVPGSGYLCSVECDVAAANSCPTGFICAPTNVGGLCIPDPDGPTPPPPPNKKGLGDPCTDNAECTSALCGASAAGKFCTQLCTDDAPCPKGFDCVPVANSEQGACLRSATSAPGTLGAQCTDHDECNSKICAEAGDGSRYCTELCDPAQGCPESFECVDVGGGQNACQMLTPDPGFDEGGSGCGCRLSAAEQLPAWGLPLLVVALALRRRRRAPRG